jgi:hypothetical protein
VISTRLRRAALTLAVACAGAVPAVREASAAGDPAIEALVASKAASVVSVKFVMKMKLSFNGQSQEQEESTEIRGTVVDPSGLVLVANDSLEGGLSQAQRTQFKARGIEVSVVPTDFKVLFGNEAKEHPATIVARDSNLGLCFLQLLDADTKPPGALDLTKTAPPGVGQVLFVVTRKPRGFDCAPVFGRLFVTGKVEKPRSMFAVSGQAAESALPAYDLTGALAGIVSTQSGSEGAESASSETFLLPLDAVARVLEQTKKRVPDVLEKARAAREAAKDEPDAPKPPTPKSPTPDEPAPEKPK